MNEKRWQLNNNLRSQNQSIPAVTVYQVSTAGAYGPDRRARMEVEPIFPQGKV